MGKKLMAIFLSLILIVAMVPGLAFASEGEVDGSAAANGAKRPVWVIMHGCNKISEQQKAMSQGANAIEIDVKRNSKYKEKPEEWKVAHSTWEKGDPNLCDYMNSSTLKNPQMTLLYIDIKSDGNSRDLVEYVHRFNLQNCGYRIMYNFHKLKLAKKEARVYPGHLPLKDLLGPNEGICIDEDNGVNDIIKWYRQQGIQNAWWSNGIASSLAEGKTSLKTYITAAQNRDGEGLVKKVCRWTYGNASHAIDHLEGKYEAGGKKTALDAVMTEANCSGAIGTKFVWHENTTIDTIKGVKKSSKVRLATRGDNPFQVVK